MEMSRTVVHHDPGIVLFVPDSNSGDPPTNHSDTTSDTH
jgi:hypothetical protein